MIPNNCLLNASDLEEIGDYCFCIQLPFYFTANNALKTQRSGNKVWVRKDERVIELQSHIKNKIEALKIRVPENIYCYSANIAFCSTKSDWFVNDNTRLRRIDLTNIWKIVEDAVADALNINDSLGVHISLSKCLLPKQIDDSQHYLAVYLTLYGLRARGHG